MGSGKALDAITKTPDSRGIIAAIRQSIRELEASLKVDMKDAINENEILKLTAAVATVRDNLTLYVKLRPEHRRQYRSMLEQALNDTSAGLNLAKLYGVPALPSFAIFVSFRNATTTILSDLDNSNLLRAYKPELIGHAEWMMKQAVNYDASLEAEARLGPVRCQDLSNGGGGFESAPYVCNFTQDGRHIRGNGVALINPKPRWQRAQAQAIRARRVLELSRFRAGQDALITSPIKNVASMWLDFAQRTG